MTDLARHGELEKLARVLGISATELTPVGSLDAPALRDLRDAISARLFDDARPVLQRVARGARLLPISLVARVGESVFGGFLCAQVAGLLAPSFALAIALRMPDPFLATVSAALDPRRAHTVVAAIPAPRVVAVAQILLARGDFITLARFVDYLAPDTIRAVIDSIPDELDLLRIATYVESAPKLTELVSQLAEPRLRAMITALHGADAPLWREALSVATQLDPTWRRRLADLAASHDPAILDALIATATQHTAWPTALAFIRDASPATRAALLARPSLPDDIRPALTTD